jgi:hypothetical protein
MSMPDPFEFLKSLWGPMGIPVPGMVTPTLNVDEIDKRISDLRSVENWLNLNLNVLKMTIQGLEMQRTTLSAMQSGIEGATRMMGQAAAATAAMGGAKAGGAAAGGANTQSAAGAGAQASANANPADAWWTVLQQAQEAAERLRTAGLGGNQDAKDGKKG